jgi:thiopurine S-methyltransferase
MDLDFWLEKWSKSETGFHMPVTHPMLARCWPQMNKGSGCRVLVPLCGKSVDMLYLAGQGCQVTGIEVSPLAIHQFLLEHQLQPTPSGQSGPGPQSVYRDDKLRLIEGDFFAVTPQQVGPMDAVYDRAALIAMPPAMQSHYAGHLMALAGRNVVILLVTLDYPASEMQGPPFSVPASRVQELFGNHYHVELLEQQDVLADNPPFRKRGVTRLSETAWRLSPC